MELESSGDVLIADNTFEKSLARSDDGGGLRIDESAHAVLTGNRFLRNVGGDDGGGGADVEACTAEITANTFEGNELIATDSEGSLEGAGLLIDGRSCSNGPAALGAGEFKTVARDADGGGLTFTEPSDPTDPFTARNLVAAGNRIKEPVSPGQRGRQEPRGRGGGLALFGRESTLRVEDSTVHGNAAGEGSGIAGQDVGRPR